MNKKQVTWHTEQGQDNMYSISHMMILCHNYVLVCSVHACLALTLGLIY